MVKDGWVYMTTNKPHGVLYIGVTSDLAERMDQHATDTAGKSFVSRYNCKHLVWCEHHDSIDDAIEREGRLKKWNRAWKDKLIATDNPDWNELPAH